MSTWSYKECVVCKYSYQVYSKITCDTLCKYCVRNGQLPSNFSVITEDVRQLLRVKFGISDNIDKEVSPSEKYPIVQ